MKAPAPMMVDGKVLTVETICTAGTYIGVVTGTGDSVSEAKERAYDIAWEIDLPSNLMFRTDIGDRLEKQLPELQKHGYAKNMVFK
jgi:phosphoribosylamine-glycine ligase